MKKVIDYYEVLRVSYFATDEEIKEAYRTKVKETHPDSITGDSELFKLVKEAYAILSIEEKRSRYNDFLFTYTKVNSPVNNYETVEVPPNKKQVNKESVPSKQKDWKKWAFLSYAINIAFIVFLFLGYNQYTQTQNTYNEIQEKLAYSEKTLLDREENLKAAISNFKLLQTEYDEYKESSESSLASAHADSYYEDPITYEESSDSSSNQITSNNPNGAFTQGSTKEHVKIIMGTPSSLNKMPLGGETWWYGGAAFVNFDANGLVEGWTDINGDVLKVQ